MGRNCQETIKRRKLRLSSCLVPINFQPFFSLCVILLMHHFLPFLVLPLMDLPFILCLSCLFSFSGILNSWILNLFPLDSHYVSQNLSSLSSLYSRVWTDLGSPAISILIFPLSVGCSSLSTISSFLFLLYVVSSSSICFLFRLPKNSFSLSNFSV